MDQHHDREEDADIFLEPSKIEEDETAEEGNEKVFEDSVSNAMTDDPSDTGNQVISLFSRVGYRTRSVGRSQKGHRDKDEKQLAGKTQIVLNRYSPTHVGFCRI
jgi:hypothetical protein